jgi:hypothetical protein
MIYRGPGFLVVVGLGSSPTPFPILSRQLALPVTHRLRKRDSLLTGGEEGAGEEGGAKSYDGEKVYKSFNTLCPHPPTF